MTADPQRPPLPDRLADIGLTSFAPYLMNRIMGRYNADLREDLSKHGLTTPKMRALAVLAVRDRLLIKELAVYAVVEISTLSRALDQLEASGLVRRSPDTEDQRAVRVTITDAGRAEFNALWPTMAAAHERMFEGIAEADRLAFVATLRRILENIRKHEF